MEKKRLEKFIEDAQKKKKRRVYLYFDNNDEMIEKEEDEEEDSSEETLGQDQKTTGEVDPKKLASKLDKQRQSEYQTKITVNLGCAEYDTGKKEITNDIFEGRSKTQNAELFIDNLNKMKQNYITEKKDSQRRVHEGTSDQKKEESKEEEDDLMKAK